jgi:hypothetical protein
VGAYLIVVHVRLLVLRQAPPLTDLTHYRAEVFVLIIAGSLPTLRPFYSLIRGHLPSKLTSAWSRKIRTVSRSQNYDSNQEPFHTIGSEPSRRAGPRGAGNITIDLGEMDNMNLNTKQDAGSSAESILPKMIKGYEVRYHQDISTIFHQREGHEGLKCG